LRAYGLWATANRMLGSFSPPINKSSSRGWMWTIPSSAFGSRCSAFDVHGRFARPSLSRLQHSSAVIHSNPVHPPRGRQTPPTNPRWAGPMSLVHLLEHLNTTQQAWSVADARRLGESGLVFSHFLHGGWWPRYTGWDERSHRNLKIRLPTIHSWYYLISTPFVSTRRWGGVRCRHFMHSLIKKKIAPIFPSSNPPSSDKLSSRSWTFDTDRKEQPSRRSLYQDRVLGVDDLHLP
jgi:hypothetical protein